MVCSTTRCSQQEVNGLLHCSALHWLYSTSHTGLSNLIVGRGLIIFQTVSAGRMWNLWSFLHYSRKGHYR